MGEEVRDVQGVMAVCQHGVLTILAKSSSLWPADGVPIAVATRQPLPQPAGLDVKAPEKEQEQQQQQQQQEQGEKEQQQQQQVKEDEVYTDGGYVEVSASVTTEGPMAQFDHHFTAPQLQQLAQWAPQMDALQEMGVEQPLQRATLLLQHNGDVKAAVKQLLAQK